MYIVLSIHEEPRNTIYNIYDLEDRQCTHCDEIYLAKMINSGCSCQNFVVGRHGEVKYTQGRLSRLKSKEAIKLFITHRIMKEAKTVGYRVLLVDQTDQGQESVKVIKDTRLSNEDTIKAMNMYYTVNAKKDECNGKVIALEGTFDIIQVSEAKKKFKTIETVKKIDEANSIINENDTPDELREKQYIEIYNDLKSKPMSYLIDKVYSEDTPSSEFVRKKAKDPKRKLGKATKQCLIIGAMLTIAASYAGNAFGAYHIMTENRVKVESELTHATKDNVMSTINSADKVTVQFKVLSGNVIVDGQNVASIKDEFKILNRVNLATNDGDILATVNQKVNVRYNYDIKDADGNITMKLSSKFRMKPEGKITDKDGKYIGEAERDKLFNLTEFSIRNADGNKTFTIVKEPLGSSFTIIREEAGQNESMLDALMQATALVRMDSKINSSGKSSS